MGIADYEDSIQRRRAPGEVATATLRAAQSRGVGGNLGRVAAAAPAPYTNEQAQAIRQRQDQNIFGVGQRFTAPPAAPNIAALQAPLPVDEQQRLAGGTQPLPVAEQQSLANAAPQPSIAALPAAQPNRPIYDTAVGSAKQVAGALGLAGATAIEGGRDLLQKGFNVAPDPSANPRRMSDAAGSLIQSGTLQNEEAQRNFNSNVAGSVAALTGGTQETPAQTATRLKQEGAATDAARTAAALAATKKAGGAPAAPATGQPQPLTITGGADGQPGAPIYAGRGANGERQFGPEGQAGAGATPYVPGAAGGPGNVGPARGNAFNIPDTRAAGQGSSFTVAQTPAIYRDPAAGDRYIQQLRDNQRIRADGTAEPDGGITVIGSEGGIEGPRDTPERLLRKSLQQGAQQALAGHHRRSAADLVQSIADLDRAAVAANPPESADSLARADLSKSQTQGQEIENRTKQGMLNAQNDLLSGPDNAAAVSRYLALQGKSPAEKNNYVGQTEIIGEKDDGMGNMVPITGTRQYDVRGGKPLTGSIDRRTSRAMPEPPQRALEYLKQNPNTARAFDAKYGEGASKKVLGK